MSRDPKFSTAGEAANLLGVSIKALRVYERHGLIEPDRSAAGYRVYGPAHIQRLHQVLALKSLGLSLAQIGACLAGLGDDLELILKVQEKDLRIRIAKLEAVFKTVVMARRQIEAGRPLALDDLVGLTRATLSAEQETGWRETLAPLFAARFSEAERETTMAPALAADELDARLVVRERLLAEAHALVGTDPGAPIALDLARRWREHAMAFAQGDEAVMLKLRAVLNDALADPDAGRKLPWHQELAFIKVATERLEAG